MEVLPQVTVGSIVQVCLNSLSYGEGGSSEASSGGLGISHRKSTLKRTNSCLTMRSHRWDQQVHSAMVGSDYAVDQQHVLSRRNRRH